VTSVLYPEIETQEIALPFSFFYSFYTLLTLFKKTPNNESKDKKIAIKKMSKKEIKKLADEIIAKKKR